MVKFVVHNIIHIIKRESNPVMRDEYYGDIRKLRWDTSWYNSHTAMVVKSNIKYVLILSHKTFLRLILKFRLVVSKTMKVFNCIKYFSIASRIYLMIVRYYNRIQHTYRLVPWFSRQIRMYTLK